jgi:hypothetical protein
MLVTEAFLDASVRIFFFLQKFWFFFFAILLQKFFKKRFFRFFRKVKYPYVLLKKFPPPIYNTGYSPST